MICYNSDARQLGIYFSTLARFDHIVHDILSGKKKITRLSVITGEIKLIPKISLEVSSKNYELTRVCFILSPKLIKPSLANSQAIAGFPWWNPRNHGASKIQQNINFTLSMKRQTFFFKNNAKSWTKPSMKNCLAKLLLEEANFTPRSDCGNVAEMLHLSWMAKFHGMTEPLPASLTYFSLYSRTNVVTIALNFSTPSKRSDLNVGWICSRWLATVPAY